MSNPFLHFSKLGLTERLQKLVSLDLLTPEQVQLLQHSSTPAFIELADNLIENTLGCFAMPFGIAVNFMIDGQERVLPMVVEETSVIAAACAAAKFMRKHGSITTKVTGDSIIGQIHVPKLQDFHALEQCIKQHKASLIADVHQQLLGSLVKRGGGITDMILRPLQPCDAPPMAAIHVLLNPADAMGANYVTQVCEYLKQRLQQLSSEQFGMAIVSNLSDSKLTQAKVILDNVDPQLAEAIEEASLFAECDPYRAATHNKGVLNGMDPILIATGNDWRAVEAATHAYACRDGQYRAISTWRYRDQQLIGELNAPIAVGTVGGVTRLHPLAQLSLSLLGVNQANELSRIVAAAGLVENFASLRALVQEGLSLGHMNLHINNLILSLNPSPEHHANLKQRLQTHLKQTGKVSLSDASAIYDALIAP